MQEEPAAGRRVPGKYGTVSPVIGCPEVVNLEKEPKMSKTNVRELQKRAERQVKNTSAGGHLGGTYFGQQPDGKTASSTNNDSAKARPNDGSK